MHAILFDMVHDSCHLFLHEQVTKHVTHIDCVASLNPAHVPLKETIQAELVFIEQSSGLTCGSLDLRLPLSELPLDVLGIRAKSGASILIEIHLRDNLIDINTDVHKVAGLAFTLDLRKCTERSEPARDLDSQSRGDSFCLFHGVSRQDNSTVLTFMSDGFPESAARDRVDTG